MAKIININNGTGTGELINGTYTVSAEVNGYDNSSINPANVTVIEGTNSYAFTVGATGTLTLHVTDDGTTTGNPIVGATFYRTDIIGTEYGSVITTDANGDITIQANDYAYDPGMWDSGPLTVGTTIYVALKAS